MKRLTKLLVLMATVLALGLLTVTASAAETKQVQSGGFELELTREDGGTWTVRTSRGGSGGDLVIPAEVDGIAVTKIAANAFISSQKINGTLTLPDTIEEIGNKAFAWASGLTGDLTIPESCETVGEDAFYSTYKTGGGTLNISAKNIGADAFCGTGFSSVYLNEGVETVGNSAFRVCKATELVIRSTKLKSIEAQAFDGCSSLTAGTIAPQEELEYIGELAFRDCGGLTGDLVIPATCQTVGREAFRNAYKAGGKLTVGAQTIADSAFKGSGFASVYLGEGVESIGTSAFESHVMTELEVCSSKLKTVGKKAFYDCRSLTTGTLSFPEGLESIGENAFYNCSGLTGDLTIAASCRSVGEYAFSGSYKAGGTLTVAAETIGARAFGTGFSAVRLAEGVKTVANYAFGGCGMTSLTIDGDTLESIGSYAFQNCANLTGEVAIPASVQTLGSYAFNGCKNLTSLRCGAADIGSYAFADCTGLSDVVISGDVQTLGDYAFKGCRGITRLECGSASIGAYAFFNAGSGSSLALLEGVREIGEQAFVGNGFAGDLLLPDSLAAIGPRAFYNCSALNGTLKLSASLETVDKEAFYGTTLTGTLSFPATLRSIGEKAFCGIKTLTGITFAQTAAEDCIIGTYAFYNCSGLTTAGKQGLTLPEGLVSIGARAFYGCSALSGSLTLPDSLVSLGDDAFNGCTAFCGSLKLSEKLETLGAYAFNNCAFTGYLTLPDSLTTIGIYAFSGSSFSGGLTVPDRVTVIGSYAFEGAFTDAANKGPLVLSRNLTGIGTDAFLDCTGFTGDLIIPDSVELMGSSPFENCSGFNGRLVLPKGLTVIPQGAFKNCSGLTGVLKIPEGVTEINTSAFEGCSGLTDLILPETLQCIDQYAFKDCAGLTGDLRLPDSVEELGQSRFPVFPGCTGLTGTLTLPASLKKLPSEAFQGMRFTELIIPEGVEVIGAYAFYGCTALTGDLILPDSVTTVQEYAFSGCIGLDGELILSRGLQSIGNSAFANCRNLNGVLKLPHALTNLGTYAFSYGNYSELYLPGIETVGTWPFKDGSVDAIYSALPEGSYLPDLGLTKMGPVYYDSYPAKSLTISGGSNFSFRSGDTFTLSAIYAVDEPVEDPSFDWSVGKPEILSLVSSHAELSGKGYSGRVTGTFRALKEGTSSVSISGPYDLSDSCVVHSVDHSDLVFVPQEGQSAVEPMQMEPGDTMELLFAYRCYGNAAEDLQQIRWETLVNGEVNNEIISLIVNEPQVDGEDAATLTARITAIGYGGPVEIRVSGPRDSSASCTVVVPNEKLTILKGDRTQPAADEILRFRQKVAEPFKFYVRYETALMDEEAVKEEIEAMTWTMSTADFFLDGVHNLDGTTVLKPEVTWTKIRDGVYELETELEAGIESVTALKIETRNKASDICAVYATFDVDSYRAELYNRTENGEKLFEVANLETWLYGDAPCQLIVEELRKDLIYQGFAISWEGLKAIFTAVDNPASLHNYTVQESDMYYALLLNVLRGTMQENADRMGKVLTAYGSKLAGDLENSAMVLGGASQSQAEAWGWVVKNQNTVYQNTFIDKLDRLHVGKAEGILSLINVGFSAQEDYQTALANNLVLTSSTASMERMLETMLEECPASNEALRDALDRCLTQVRKTAEELQDDAELGVLASVGTRGYQAVFDIVWDQLMEGVKVACPPVAIFYMAYTVGDTLSNLNFQTNDLLERYYMMKGYEEIRQVARKAERTLNANWLAKPSGQAAADLLCAVDVLYRLQCLDAELAIDYTETAIHAKNPQDEADLQTIRKLQESMEQFERFEANVITAYEPFQIMWYSYFQKDYPQSLMDLQYADVFEAVTGERPKRIVVVACPVDVYVRSSSGSLAASVVNEQISCPAEDIMVTLLGDQKIISFYGDARYTLEYKGYDTGTMSVTDRSFDADGNETRLLRYYDLPVTEGKSYTDSGAGSLRETGKYVSPDGDSLDHAAYTVTMVDGLVRTDGAFAASAVAAGGQMLQIMAKVPEGQPFGGWTSDAGTGIFEDPASPVTTVRMPAEDVVITAEYSGSPDHPPANRLLLTDEAGQVLTDIPQGHFTVYVSAPAAGAHCAMACYGQSGNLVRVQLMELPENGSRICQVRIDNSDNAVRQLKFICLTKDFAPVQKGIAFPTE